VSVPFTSIGWSKYGEETEEHKYGFIVGGHEDGSVSLWEASTVLNAKENKKVNFGLLQSKKFHTSSVNVIKFNQKPNLIATGSRDIVIISIEKNMTMESPVKCPSQDGAEISSLNWNDKVPHILASATTTGMTYIWEMKKTEVFVKIVDQNLLSDEERRETPTQILWSNDGVQIIIAYDHPEFNFLTQYHMKQPNAPIAEYYGGHRDSIVQTVKNPNDSNFILSLGRDDMVTCWSIRTQKHVAQNTLQERSSTIAWLNKTPDIFLAVSYEGSVTHHQVNFSTEAFKTETNEYPPKWMFKKSGVSFAFGGKLATFNEKNQNNVTIHALQGNAELSSKMKNFIEKVEKQDLTEVLDEKIQQYSNSAKDKNAQLFWVALKCSFTKDFSELFRVMGYDKSKLQNEVYAYIGKKVEKVQKKERTKIANININALNDEKEAEKFWSEAISKTETESPINNKNSDNTLNNLPVEKPLTIQETVTKNINWNLGAEKLIKQSLLIGDLESAVDVALKCGREAEALLIASAGDKELFNKAKQSFFNKNKDLFIKNIFSSIINNNFESLFEYNVLKDWKEYILYAKTYLQGPQFLTFANNLGDRLSNNPDIYMALVCYVLGNNFEKCVELLHNNYIKETEKLTKNDKKAFLQNLFEHVVSVKNVMNYNHPNERTDKIFSEYSELLNDEGLFVEACTYLARIKNTNSKILTLFDRLYNHLDSKLGSKFSKMQSPFNIMTVKPKVEKRVEKISTKPGPGQRLPNTTKDIFSSGVTTNAKKPFEEENRLGGGVTNPPLNKPNPFPESGVNKPSSLSKPQPFVPVRNVVNPPVVENTSINREINAPSNTINPNTNKTPVMPKPIINKPVNPPKPVINTRQPEEEPVHTPSTYNNPPVTGGHVSRPSFPTPTPTPLNPPRPNFPNKPVQPMQPVQPVHPTPSNPSHRQPSPASTNSGNAQPMNADEELIYTSFEKFISIYNGIYPDENKQKDFFNRASALLTKLKNHEIKPNLLRLLIDFINCKFYFFNLF
jgi:protein transport protein SEC31